jgi:hypothetical protein
MSLARAARKLVTEGRKHFRDLSGNDSKTGKPLTTRQKAGGKQIKPAAEGTRAVRAGKREGAAVGLVGGATIEALINKATTKAEKTDNPVTKAGTQKAFRDLGAAYRQSVKNAQSGETSRKAVKALSKSNLTAFEKAFAAAAKRGDKTFKFEVDGVMKPFTVTYKKKKK